MFGYFLRAKAENFRKTDPDVYSDYHGQNIWDEHIKNNIFKKYITYQSQSQLPPLRNNVDVHLNYYGNNCNTC